CKICSDLGNGVHFGVVTCEGCKKFYRRALHEHRTYVCKLEGKCIINPQTRNSCRYCRYEKCKLLGM
ncbi:hypothetical protein HELRODRAFT_148333, partial [Helobdella robusta]|uniref:Nuclear receptor domain-containing protein n=1 Tax=Helobdella robusta TaxID=6412 RepID=T1EK74_HELRO